jgi:putative endonuclease
MKRTTRETGQYAEGLAAEFLLSQGYAILAKNWHCAEGGLDIVAQKHDVVVFVEVRARMTTDSAFESINPRKQQRLQKAAYQFLAAHGLDEALWQIDVIGVALPRSGAPQIDHVENALDWS